MNDMELRSRMTAYVLPGHLNSNKRGLHGQADLACPVRSHCFEVVGVQFERTAILNLEVLIGCVQNKLAAEE